MPTEIETNAARNMRIALELSLVFATCVGVWYRWFGIDAQSMWADEGYTTWLTKYSLSAILTVLPTDTFPPLYYFLLHLWRGLFGNSVNAIRSLSVVSSTLCLPVMYLVARKIFQSRLCGLIALAFTSLSYFPVWYAKEVRPYAFLEFVSCLCVYCMVLALEKTTIVRLLLVSLCITAVLYTHTMTLFYMPGIVIFWMCYPSELGARGRLKNAALVGVVVLLLYAPWIRTLWMQVRWVHAGFWPAKPDFAAMLKTICTYCGVDTEDLQLALRARLSGTRLFGFLTWMPLVMLALGIGLVHGIASKEAVVRRKVLAISAVATLPILLAFVDSRLLTSVFVPRVFIGAGVFLPLLFCFPIAFSRNWSIYLRVAPAVTILLLAALSLSVQHEERDNWRGVTRYVLSLPEPDREVFAFQPYCQMLLDYYSNQLTHPGRSVQIKGLMTKAEIEDPANPTPHIPVLANADPLGMLSDAIGSRRYKEIDVALQMYRLPPSLIAMPSFLQTHCSSVSATDFGGMRVTRCMTVQ
jgi:4-amino-4-deoxy-L-arabinose transferase-like glycosyltransferase